MVTVLEYQYDMQETIDQVRTQSSSLEHGEFRQGETEGPLKTYVYFSTSLLCVCSYYRQRQVSGEIIPILNDKG